MPRRIMQKCGVETVPTEKRVFAANETELLMDGEAEVALMLNGQAFMTKTLVTPDIEEIMLGSDWLAAQECLWDFRTGKIVIKGQPAIPMSRKGPILCQRVFVEEEVVIPPRKETTVSARSTLVTPRTYTKTGMVEARKIQSGVYLGHTLLPPTHRRMAVRIANTTDKPVMLASDSFLGRVVPVEVVSDQERDRNVSMKQLKPTPRNEPGSNIIRMRNAYKTRVVKETTERNLQHAQNVTMSTPVQDDVQAKLMAGLPEGLTASERAKVEQLIMNYDDVFSRGPFDMGRTTLVEQTIDTGNHRPIRQALRRHPIAQLETIDQHVDELIKNDFVEPAASPWASNVLLVKKKDGSYHLCVDYRAINAVTYKDSYPLPHIDTCLGSMDGAIWFSTLDLRSGYHAIPKRQEDRDKTAFVTRRGCFRYKVMPFGLTCAPSVFQRLVDLVLIGLTYISVLVYLDDIIVFSRDFDTHVSRLGEVLERLRKANLKLHPSKCHLFQRRVSFLGHVISEKGIEMQEEKISVVRDWPVPRNITELRSFLGLCSYYRRFVKNFSNIAAPLHRLQRKDAPFVWTEEQETAFNQLKEALTTAPVLGMPREDGVFKVDTDASSVGLGAVLSQDQDGREVVIAYSSRSLSRAERNYDVTKKELLAVVFALKTFKQYVLERHFEIRTDHAALQWLMRTPEPMGQLARWLTFIEMFDFEIRHRAGAQHGNADGLSRRPVTIEEELHVASALLRNETTGLAPERDTQRDKKS